MQESPTSRRRMLAASAALACPGLRSPARAQADYPARPIRVVVPFGPGSSPDVIARIWGERLAKAVGQPVVIDNRAGASTITGAQAAATARADGHTLFYTVNNTFSINPFIYGKLPYRVEDFAPVIRVLSVPYVLIVPANSPIRTGRDLIGAAKAKPGELTYGSYGIGQGTHVAMARFLNAAGASMTHVPYRDGAINDLLAGRIDVLVEASTTAIPYVQDGKVRALAVTGPRRVEALPEVPAVAETFPGFVGDSWHGVFVPAGTPAEAVSTLVAQLQRIIEAEDFRAKLREFGLIPAGGTPDDFRKFLAADAEAWAKVVRDNGIKVD